MHGYSLLSSEPIQAQEVEWLMSRFSAVLDHGTLVVRWEGGEAVLADATGELASMPPTIVELARRALGEPPVWQASLMVFGRDAQQVAEQIATAFGQYWPIALDDDSAEPPRRIGNFSE